MNLLSVSKLGAKTMANLSVVTGERADRRIDNGASRTELREIVAVCLSDAENAAENNDLEAAMAACTSAKNACIALRRRYRDGDARSSNPLSNIGLGAGVTFDGELVYVKVDEKAYREVVHADAKIIVVSTKKTSQKDLLAHLEENTEIEVAGLNIGDRMTVTGKSL